MGQVTVDFVARDQPHGGWSLILIEQGPWDTDAISDHLRRIQDRLYTCLDAALEGAVTAQYPESRGKPLMIRLEAFNVPEAQLRSFFSRFTSEVPKLPDYGKALCEQQFFPMVSFELNVGTEDSGCPRLRAPTESPKKR
jgi:hypothetical protein